MISYRITIFDKHGDEQQWQTVWFVTKADAMSAFSDIAKSNKDAQLDKMDFPTDKASLVWALNASHNNPQNFPGEKLKSCSASLDTE